MSANPLVQSLLRGLSILEQVAASEDGRTLAELAESLGCKPSTVHNLIRTLASRGYLERVTRPVRYRLGPGALNLADQQQGKGFWLKAEAVLRDMMTAYPKFTVSLAEVRGGEIVVAMRIMAERPGTLERPTDLRMQPYANASGLVYQAYWDSPMRLECRQRYPFYEFGAHLWESEAELDTFLDQVRKRAVVVPKYRPEVGWLVAVPVFGSNGQLRAVLGVRLPPHEKDWDVEQVVEYAKGAAQELGQFA